eukprot:COSAG02_NODE_573_length_20153_cov_11.609305_16_plen_404_part_00
MVGSHCGDMDGILPNSTVTGTVAVAGDKLEAAVLDTAARAAAHVLHCGSIAVRWNTPGVLHAPGNVFQGLRRSVLHSLGLSSDDAGAQPPMDMSTKEFLLSDHSNRGRDRYEMVIPFGAHTPFPWSRLFRSDWFVFNAASTLAEVLRRSPTLVLAASAVLGLPAHIEMISALVAMPGAVGGPLGQPSEPGMDHRVIIDIPLPLWPLQSGTSADGREQGEEWERSGDDNGHDEPSIAVCVGNSHKVWWLSTPHAAGENAKQPREHVSTEEKRAQLDDNVEVEGSNRDTERAVGSGTHGQSCTERQGSDDKHCQAPTGINGDDLDSGKVHRNPGLTASSRDGGGAGVERRAVNAPPAANSKVEASDNHDRVAEQICAYSVKSRRTSEIFEWCFASDILTIAYGGR